MRGNVVHRWNLPFRQAFPIQPRPRPTSGSDDSLVSMRRVYPNGDVVANYQTDLDTPHGYGLVKCSGQRTPTSSGPIPATRIMRLRRRGRWKDLRLDAPDRLAGDMPGSIVGLGRASIPGRLPGGPGPGRKRVGKDLIAGSISRFPPCLDAEHDREARRAQADRFGTRRRRADNESTGGDKTQGAATNRRAVFQPVGSKALCQSGAQP